MAAALSCAFSCNHYQRKCKLVTPCCNKIYTCRFCHDEQESHTLNRKAVKEVVCMVCGERQDVRYNCYSCEVKFGKYYCLECNLFDDEDKGQFHCEGCGICRVGGGDNFFHCDVCNMCLSIGMLGNHKCVENRSHTDCPICMEDMHSSRSNLHIPKCGHLLHETCFQNMDKAGHKLCPICKDSFKV
ncbi:RING finger and CHY zinc finger domain-containing protein 1-like [Zophobas morio]|uniref:RING finger and CHY zinc finger domain-containing protein 1-like n=1 Tax=Zophobas morio TaxID=2755281 RepID=UPI0030833582